MEDRPAPAPPRPIGQIWNTAAYAANGRFVADLATGVVDLLAPCPGERILDLGCGDGALTARLAATGAILTGIDASTLMVEAARARNIDALHITATELPFEQEFDAVFSNAALHWIPEADQALALANIHRALKPGGRFVAEMGGLGNIAAMRTALSASLAPLGIDAEAQAASFFPSSTRYRSLLASAGFDVHSIAVIPRPTPLPGGPNGMEIWLQTFRNGILDQLDPKNRAEVTATVVRLLRPILFDESGLWMADYVRLRFHASRAI